MKAAFKDYQAKIISNKKVTKNIFLLSLNLSQVFRFLPGQFVMLKIDERLFLRRPLSVFYSQGRRLVLLYRVVGRGTRILAEKTKGETLSLLGPLGNYFKIDPGVRRIILVAGGLGFVPFYSFLKRIKKGPEIIFVLGAKNKKDLGVRKLLYPLAEKAKFMWVTEDGSLGEKGLASDIFEREVESEDLVFACGPQPMLKKIGEFCADNGIKGYLSLEERMACGVGICLACVVKIKKDNSFEYQRVCRDGPIFCTEDVLW